MLKDYLLKGYAVNQRFEKLRGISVQNKVDEFDFRLRKFASNEGIFFDGQVFDAYFCE